MKEYFLSSLALVILTLVQVWQTWPSQETRVIFCDVAQGDAVLITRGTDQVLIDGGRHPQAALACLTAQLPFWDRRLELVVATHADADHIGGLASVLAQYHVQRFLSTSYDKENLVMADLKRALAEEVGAGMVLENPILGQQLVFPQEKRPKKRLFSQNVTELIENTSSLRLTILSPQVSSQRRQVQKTAKSETILSDVNQFFSQSVPPSQSYNNLSIVIFLEFGQSRVLLTGDLETAGELSLLKAGLLRKVDLLKVAHHGAKTSTSREFLQVVQPEIAVISVGANNSYGHPTDQVIASLGEFESQIWRTDVTGTIVYELQPSGEAVKLESPVTTNFFQALFRF